jgi:hypothetical protein
MISRFIEVICGFVPPRSGVASPSSGRIPHLTPITSRIHRRFNLFGALGPILSVLPEQRWLEIREALLIACGFER